MRLNYTQPLCACPSRYREPCSASLNSDDLHTTELSASPYGKVLEKIKDIKNSKDKRYTNYKNKKKVYNCIKNARCSNNNYFQVYTLVKTCEPVADMRLCRAPRDWSLLALQNIRTGKSHYLVICRCPYTSTLGDILFVKRFYQANIQNFCNFSKKKIVSCFRGSNES